VAQNRPAGLSVLTARGSRLVPSPTGQEPKDAETAYAIVDPIFLPKESGFEGRLEFLHTMLNKAVMEYKADELGYDKDPAVVQGMEAHLKLGLQAGFLKRRIVDRITVEEEEVLWHYNNKGVTLNIKQILLDTPEEADMVYELLEDGADYDSILKEHSKAPDATNGGKVMTITYGNFAPTLQYAAFDLEVGEYTQPLLTPYGFFIIKVVRRTEAKRQDPYDKNRDTYEQEVRVLKEMIATNALTNEIRESYGMTWYWDGIRACYDALPPDRPLTNPPRRQEEVYPLLYFDEIDLDKPVVSYNNKTIAVKDFSGYYDQASFFTRPRRDFRLGGIRSFLTERMMSELIPIEMEKSDIANDPEIARAIKNKRYELMVNRLYDDMINKQTNVTDKEINEYYRENQATFVVPEKRRFGVILVGDVDAAQMAYKDIKNGELFRSVAMAYTIDETTRRTLAETELLSKGEQPELDKVGFDLQRVGAVSEPFETSRGYMILKLTERQDSRKYTIDEARGSIQGALKQTKNDTRLKELLEKWKEEVEVVVYEDNLREVQVEDRSAASPTATGK
jgi:parvulin-like peptidyl-prolyl isomerase